MIDSHYYAKRQRVDSKNFEYNTTECEIYNTDAAETIAMNSKVKLKIDKKKKLISTLYQQNLPEILVHQSYQNVKYITCESSVQLNQIERGEYLLAKLAIGNDFDFTSTASWVDFIQLVRAYDWTSKIQSVFQCYGDERGETLSSLLEKSRMRKTKQLFELGTRIFHTEIKKLSDELDVYDFNGYLRQKSYVKDDSKTELNGEVV